MYLISNFVKIVWNTFPFFFSLNFIFKISHLYLCSFAFRRSCCWLFWRTHSSNAACWEWMHTHVVLLLKRSYSFILTALEFPKLSGLMLCYFVLSERLSAIKLSAFLLSVFVWNLPNTGSDSPPARSVNAWKTSIYVVFLSTQGRTVPC